MSTNLEKVHTHRTKYQATKKVRAVYPNFLATKLKTFIKMEYTSLFHDGRKLFLLKETIFQNKLY